MSQVVFTRDEILTLAVVMWSTRSEPELVAKLDAIHDTMKENDLLAVPATNTQIVPDKRAAVVVARIATLLGWTLPPPPVKQWIAEAIQEAVLETVSDNGDVKAEREACARLADEQVRLSEGSSLLASERKGGREASMNIAAAIRQRGRRA